MELEAKHILTAPNVVCPSCGSKLFIEAVALKKLSAILSPTGREEIVPIPTFVCVECGTVPAEYTNNRHAKEIFGENDGENVEAEEPNKPSIIMP